MIHLAAHASLAAAKTAKNDEFYTQWSDIENEMNAYLDYDQDVFRGKVILLPCDDPEWSNFTKYFAKRFEQLGLKKLISTSYTPQGNGRIFILDRDTASDGMNTGWEYLDGDGDFRSDEVTALRDEADMVITNPPFSLFREFMAWLVEGEVEFSVIGNVNAVTYKGIFPLIKDNKMWPGSRSMLVDMLFDLPETRKTELLAMEKPGSKYRIVDGDVRGRAAAWWYTNIEHGCRRDHIELNTMEYNIRHCRRKTVRERGYPKYDNYDAIEVSFTEAIPSDYGGAMGVPISFLDKYSPDQFEILGSFNAGSHGEEVGSTYTPTIIGGKEKLWNGPVIDKRPLYKRILIRHRRPESKQSES